MRVAFASFIAAVIVASACADLPQIDRGVCGNFVLETGEDCDTPKADPYVCRSCRFDCSATPCPIGFGCGADFVCRKPSGTFETTGPEIAVDAKRLETGDFDGDRRFDVVAETTGEFRVHYFDGRGDPTRTFSVLGASPHATCALGSKPLATLATSAENSVSVWRGQSDRTLATTLYPSLAIAGAITQARVFVTDVLPATSGRPFIQDEYMTGLTFGEGSLSILTLGQFDPMKQPYFTWLTPLDKLVGPIFDRFNPKQNCDTMVFAYAGTNEIRAFTLCNGNFANSGSGAVITKATRFPSRIVSGDINVDGTPDIAMQSTNQVAVELSLNFSGTFTPTFELSSPTISGTLLAVGNIDGDQSPDWIESNGIHLSTALDAIVIPATNLTQAIVRDANADGFPDIIAIGTGGAYFVFGTGTGVATSSFRALDGTPKFLLVSDFDGDRVDDILVSTDLGDSANLWIQWGREKQFPEPFAFVGSLSGIRIEDLAGGIIAPFLNGGTSGAAIAPILSRRTETNQLEAPVLLGSPSRVLQSPFLVAKNDLQGVVVGVVAGHFTASDHEGLAFIAQDVGATRPFRTWTVPSTGDAQLDPSQLVRSPDPLPLAVLPPVQPSAWDVPFAAALDLETDGIDELVMLAPPESTASGKQGALLVGRASLEGFTTTSQDVGMGLRGPWTLYANDLDGDGRKDVVLRFTDSPDHYVLRLIMNRGDGTLDLGKAIDIPLPNGDMAADVTMLRTDPTSAQRTLAVAGAQRIYVIPWTGSGIGPIQTLGSSGATSITAGDVDGDGVDDLVIGRQGTVSVWFQRAVGEK